MLHTSKGWLNLVCMDAEVVGKKEICCFCGKLGENVANQSCGRGQWSDIL